MLITKRSRRRSELFDSRFRDGRGADFPLRQYLRCREDFVAGIVHALLLLAFAITLLFFTRTLNDLFLTHGAHLKPWYRYVALALLAFFSLSVLRRLYYKVRELRDVRQEMQQLKSRFRAGGD